MIGCDVIFFEKSLQSFRRPRQERGFHGRRSCDHREVYRFARRAHIGAEALRGVDHGLAHAGEKMHMLMAVDVIRRATHHAREGFELALQFACDRGAIEPSEIGLAHQRGRAAVGGQCKVETDVGPSEKGSEKGALHFKLGMDDHAARRREPPLAQQVADAAAHSGRETVIVRTQHDVTQRHLSPAPRPRWHTRPDPPRKTFAAGSVEETTKLYRTPIRASKVGHKKSTCKRQQDAMPAIRRR